MTMKIDWMRGCGTALVTPFRKDGSIDDDCFRKLVERQIKNGVKLLVPCGTTGESVTMDEAERLHVIRMTVEVAKGQKAHVIAGTGSNNTAATIDFTRRAREAGAIENVGETVLSASIVKPVWVRTYVSEPDLGKIKAGMAVEVRSDSGGAFVGHVGFISPVAEFTPKSVETKELRTSLVYRLRVVVDGETAGLLQGMPVTIVAKLTGNTAQ